MILMMVMVDDEGESVVVWFLELTVGVVRSCPQDINSVPAHALMQYCTDDG
jgi:hypothetical protein